MAKLTNERKSQLRKTITELEGLSAEDKSALIELLNTHKKYGLVWEDKPEDVEEAMRDHLPLLTEVKERAILSDSPEAPNHILIEGDNLEALTALSYTHEGKIDVIYIDPPYNTGNKDFIYNDSFVDSEDAYRHSKWLSFMSRRLKLAKRLLSDKGVIFISIDDNEQANLKLLCDEIFGEKNFKSNSIIINNRGGRDYGGVALQHDYILIYSKSLGELNLINEVDKKFQYEDELGGFNLMELRNRNVKFNIDNRPNLCYPFYVNPNSPDLNGLLEISLEPKPDFIEVYPAQSNGIQTVWRWGKEEKSRKNLNVEIFGKVNRNGGYMIVQKYRKTVKMQRSVWDEKEFVNERGSEVLKEILTQNIFSYPKSLFTIKRVLELGSGTHSIILDFFAGSGTTLHATMQLNAEDGGKRKCILVTNNENKICEEVTYERNKRVINGYTTPKGEKVEGLKNNSLRYYKTKLMSRERTQRNMRELVAAATELLCVKEDLYEEKTMFGQYKVNPRLIRYFDDGERRMLVIYREEVIDEVVVEIEKMEYEGKMKIYLFAPGRYAFDDNFYPVHEKVTLCALPAAIYDAYEKVLPKHRIADDQSKDTECCALDEQNELGQQNYVEQMLFSNEGGEQ